MARELKGGKLEKELLRLEEMKAYEKENAQYELICGIDEAGRGPLAGPVVVAGAIMPEDSMIEGVNDSKKVSEKKREILYDKIIEEAIKQNPQMQIKLKLQANQEQQIEKQIKIQTDRQTVSPHQEKESRIQQKVKKSFFI